MASFNQYSQSHLAGKGFCYCCWNKTKNLLWMIRLLYMFKNDWNLSNNFYVKQSCCMWLLYPQCSHQFVTFDYLARYYRQSANWSIDQLKEPFSLQILQQRYIWYHLSCAFFFSFSFFSLFYILQFESLEAWNLI